MTVSKRPRRRHLGRPLRPSVGTSSTSPSRIFRTRSATSSASFSSRTASCFLAAAAGLSSNASPVAISLTAANALVGSFVVRIADSALSRPSAEPRARTRVRPSVAAGVGWSATTRAAICDRNDMPGVGCAPGSRKGTMSGTASGPSDSSARPRAMDVAVSEPVGRASSWSMISTISGSNSPMRRASSRSTSSRTDSRLRRSCVDTAAGCPTAGAARRHTRMTSTTHAPGW